MRVENIRIQKYRSIDDVVISFPANKPVVLFGPNNAGKSNILSAIDRLLGEKYPTYIEMLESDYFIRLPIRRLQLPHSFQKHIISIAEGYLIKR